MARRPKRRGSASKQRGPTEAPENGPKSDVPGAGSPASPVSTGQTSKKQTASGPRNPARLPAPPADWVRLGHIGGAHGIRGEVILKPYTAEPDGLVAYGDLHEEGGSRVFVIETARVSSKGVIARLVGVANRNAAEALKGVVLGVPRDALPAPDEDEFYVSDLVGLKVVHLSDGLAIGQVMAIHDFGAGDLLDVRRTGSRKTVLIPFTKEIVPEVDMAAGVLRAVPPPGLLDETEGGVAEGAEAEPRDDSLDGSSGLGEENQRLAEDQAPGA